MERRAQTEIFGLAIVVVLLSFGMILILTYSGGGVPNELKELNEELADKFINAMLKTTTECDLHTMQDLMGDVARYPPFGSITCGNSQSSYEYLNESLRYILDNTIEIWTKQGYQFSIYVNKESPFFYFSRGTSCQSKTGKEYYTPMRDGTVVYTRLYICV